MKRQGFLFDYYILLMIGMGAAANAALWYFLKHSIGVDTVFVPLHFTAASGIDLIGEPSELFRLPYIAVLLSAVNIALARLAYQYDILSSYMLVTAVPLLNGFVFFNGYLLVTVNG